MTLTLYPGTAAGTTEAPPSKSITHRAIFAGLLGGVERIERPLLSADTVASIRATESLGAEVTVDGATIEIAVDELTPATIDVENSGTTMRIATAFAALVPGTSRLYGDDSLNSRPMGPLVSALNEIGASASCEGSDGRPPVTVRGPAEGGSVAVDATISSQFVTALSMIGPRLPAGIEIIHGSEVVSRPYIEMTVSVLEEIGFEISTGPDRITIEPQELEPTSIEVPGDYSGAAFPLIAGAISGGRVTVTDVPVETAQGDAQIIDFLDAFGVPVERGDGWIRVEGRPEEGARIDLSMTPDLFPPLAALAATIEDTTEFVGAPHLRAKESDRIAAMVEGLRDLGINASPRQDGATIDGGTPSGGTVHSHDDHRVQMALSLLGLGATDPVQVTGSPEAYTVSYPGFPAMLTELGIEFTTTTERSGAPEAGR